MNMYRKELSEFGCDGPIIAPDDLVLITGASGFIGLKVLESLLGFGFRNLRCLVRPSSDIAKLEALSRLDNEARVEIVKGNLLSRDDCFIATERAAVIFHLAARRGENSIPEAYMNSVVTTRNILEAAAQHRCVQRFVNISSFSVYTNIGKARRSLLDESSPVEVNPELRGDAYCFAKVKQDEIVREYCTNFKIPYVVVRPGQVYGPGNESILGRVGTNTFGVFLHLGGSNRLPLTFVDNCAEAIVLAGLAKGVEGEVFNVVDDDLPSSREFLRLYKHNVRHFKSFYVPHGVSYVLYWLWELYSQWSEGQLPPTFNRRAWHAFWKQTQFSNVKLKTRVGWAPRVSKLEGFKRYFEYCRSGGRHA